MQACKRGAVGEVETAHSVPWEPVESDPTRDTGMITVPHHVLENLAAESHRTA